MIPRALVAVALLAAACGTTSVDLADPVVDPTTTLAPATTTTTTTTATSTTTTSTTTTTTTRPVPPLQFDEEGVPINGQTRGVVNTTTGWVVPVLESVADGWRVWTPCGREAVIGAGDYVEAVDFVIDPGHGGSEPGAVGPGGTREADINLQVSRRVRDGLEAAGYTVQLVRDADQRVPIVTRAEIARALDPIAFISIHHNAGTEAPSATPGTEMYFQVGSDESKRLAGILYEEARAVLDPLGADWFAMSDAGAMVRENREGGDYYGVLRRPGPVLSVLAEFAYMTNPTEEALLNRADVQDGLAGAVVAAVERFTQTDDPGSGFTEDPIFRGFGPSGAGRTTNCDDPGLE